MIGWYRAGLDVEREIPKLATYLGHVHVHDTYWYLEAVPELLSLATERLLDHVWDEHADPFTRTVRVTISNLRRKLRLAGSEDLIETVVGAGYRLCQPS